MNGIQKEIIKMSDCCHGGFKEIDIRSHEEDEEYIIYECVVCNDPCDIIEMVVEEG